MLNLGTLGSSLFLHATSCVGCNTCSVWQTVFGKYSWVYASEPCLINFRICLDCACGISVEGACAEGLAVVGNLSGEDSDFRANAGCLCLLNGLNLILDLQMQTKATAFVTKRDSAATAMQELSSPAVISWQKVSIRRV